MSDIKCPFCQQELEIGGVDGILRGCPKCRNLGTEMLWQELIRTRKALDVAKDALKRIAGTNKECDIGWKMIEMKNNAHDTLNQIKTVLEQKDHFANTSKKVEQKDK